MTEQLDVDHSPVQSIRQVYKWEREQISLLQGTQADCISERSGMRIDIRLTKRRLWRLGFGVPCFVSVAVRANIYSDHFPYLLFTGLVTDGIETAGLDGTWLHNRSTRRN
jgi:hypothetical protein